MEKLSINFERIADVEKFVKIVSNYDFEVTLSQGKYEVDGSSLMGIFSLDMTKPIDIIIGKKDNSVGTFIDEIKEYIA
ncbi:MAG: HPr family phosphocarrier protein [Ruminococcus sp.]|nr:HPr family phosphocarrier protein [Ruminococcus sp.]MCD7800956.1 HPr family phosphocarrier protein [Ruminococcus sp.]